MVQAFQSRHPKVLHPKVHHLMAVVVAVVVAVVKFLRQ